MASTVILVATAFHMCKGAVAHGTVGPETCRDSSSLLQGSLAVASAESGALVVPGEEPSPLDSSHEGIVGSHFVDDIGFLEHLSLLTSSQGPKAGSSHPGKTWKKPGVAKFIIAYVSPFVLIVFAWFLPHMHERAPLPQPRTSGKIFEEFVNGNESVQVEEKREQKSASVENNNPGGAAAAAAADAGAAVAGVAVAGAEAGVPGAGGGAAGAGAAAVADAAAGAGAGDDTKGRSALAKSLVDVVLRIGPLWPLSILNALSSGISGPSSGYIGLNFFAQHHTDMAHKQIHCELDPSAQHCRLAVMDLTQINMWVGLVAPFIQVLLGPALGALSDAYGRRPVLVIAGILSILPNLAVASFMYFDTSLYASYWMVPLSDIPSGAVSYAYAVDRINDPASIASAFGVLTAAGSMCRLVGMLIGSRLSLMHAFTVSFVIGLVSLTWVVFLLPESLQEKHRQPLERRFLIPGFGLKILVRNPLLARLAFVAVVSHFVDSGFNSIAGSYLQLYLNWTAHDNYISSLLAASSSILWLALGMSLTVRLFGELGVLNLSRWACTVFGISFLVSTKKWHIFLIQAAFCGPMTLGFPTVAALKGQSVTAAEQGLMQGALNTVACIAGSVAPLAFGIIFTATNDPNPGGQSDRKQIIIYGLCLCAPLLLTLLSLPWLVRKYIVLPKKAPEKSVN